MALSRPLDVWDRELEQEQSHVQTVLALQTVEELEPQPMKEELGRE